MGFPFLELPGEIRNQILCLLLTHRTPIVTRSANHLAPPKPTPLHICPNILLASWQIYHEGLAFLYSDNTFQAHPSYLTSMLFAMDPSRILTTPLCLKMVKRFHIRVRLDCDPYYGPEAVKAAFSGAEKLEVEIFRSSWAIGGYDALEGFVKVRGVRSVKVHGSVGTGFARWLETVMQAPEGRVVEDCGSIEDFGWVAAPELQASVVWGQDR